MKVKMTATIRKDDLLAGLIYELPEGQALKIISDQKGSDASQLVTVDVTSISDKKHVFVEGQKKVKRDNRKNDS